MGSVSRSRVKPTMDSPSIPTRTRKSRRIQKSSVEIEDSASTPGKIRIPESAPDDLSKSHEADKAHGRDSKPGLSIEDDDTDTTAQAMSSSVYRRGGGSKWKKGSSKKRMQQEEKSKEKLKVLADTLKLIPFKPLKKTLDFSRHETLLKTLGLWDFLHLEFDQHIQYDLLAQLIASFSPETKCSYVNGARINISRADLARALKLPTKKERVIILDEDNELLESDESMRCIDEIVSDWILLHCDDAWMVPDQVVEWRKGIKEKKLGKLDWAGLFWIMVEKELKAEPSLGHCFYASHMQMLIRSQKKVLLREHAEEEDDDVKAKDSLIKSQEEETPQEQSRVEDVEVKVGSTNPPEEDTLGEQSRVEDVEVKVGSTNPLEEDTPGEQSRVEDVEVKVGSTNPLEEDTPGEQSRVEDVEVKVGSTNPLEEDTPGEQSKVEDVEVKVGSTNPPEEDTLGEQSRVEDVEVMIESTNPLEEDTPREQLRVEDVEIKEVDLKVIDDIAAVNLRMDDGASDSKGEKGVEEHKIELNIGQEAVSENNAKEEHHHEEQQTNLEENKEQAVDLEENKEQPMDLVENKEQHMDLEENKEQPMDLEESKEQPMNLDENLNQPMDLEENNEQPIDLEENKKQVMDLEENQEQPVDLEENKKQPRDLEENKEQAMDLEKNKELPVDLEERKEQPMDFEENKEEVDEKWNWNEYSHAGSHFRDCDVGDATVGDEGKRMGERDETLEGVAEEEDREKHEGGFPLFPESETLEEVAQDNLLLDDTSSLGYNSGLQIHGSDLLASRAGMDMVPGSSHFGNDNKREIDHGDDISYHFDNPATKRMKTDGPSWDDKQVPFEVCMEQIKHVVDKAKLSIAEKDRACGESNMNEQMLMNELQRREEIVQQLRKETYDEQRRKDIEIYKLENELRMMTSVLAGYRKALKEKQKASRKHMRCCPLRGESLYKDGKGDGGLVRSNTEVEKLGLKQEEEEKMRRGLIERQVEEAVGLWIKEYEVKLNQKLELVEEKLVGFQNNVKLLKETVSRRRVLDTPEELMH